MSLRTCLLLLCALAPLHADAACAQESFGNLVGDPLPQDEKTMQSGQADFNIPIRTTCQRVNGVTLTACDALEPVVKVFSLESAWVHRLSPAAFGSYTITVYCDNTKL